MKFQIDRRFLAALVMAALLTSSGRVRAESAGATSLEWLACSAEMIVVGTLTDIVTARGPGSVTYEDCGVDVEKVLKGDLDGKRIAFMLRGFDHTPSVQSLLKSKSRVLLFLSKSKDHGSERHLDGKWIPASSSSPPSIVDLSQPPDNVYSKDMKIVSDNEEMLKIVAHWAKSPVKHFLWEDVPYGSPIFGKLWAGSGVSLIVPAEEKYRERFMTLAKSAEPWERARAAAELYKFPGDETEAVLRQLLDDDSQLRSTYSQDQIAHIHYHVRSAAYRSLQTLGKPVPELALGRAPTAAEQRELRVKTWTSSFREALKEGWTISVEDGPARQFQEREHTIVIVACRRKNEQATFTLVPKQWPADELPETEFLGINGINSGGARRFFLDGELPAEVKQQVVAYFGLEK